MHASRNVTNLLPFSTLEGSRCHLIPVLSGLQECNYMTLQYKQVMMHAQPPLTSNMQTLPLRDNGILDNVPMKEQDSIIHVHLQMTHSI